MARRTVEQDESDTMSVDTGALEGRGNPGPGRNESPKGTNGKAATPEQTRVYEGVESPSKRKLLKATAALAVMAAGGGGAVYLASQAETGKPSGKGPRLSEAVPPRLPEISWLAEVGENPRVVTYGLEELSNQEIDHYQKNHGDHTWLKGKYVEFRMRINRSQKHLRRLAANPRRLTEEDRRLLERLQQQLGTEDVGQTISQIREQLTATEKFFDGWEGKEKGVRGSLELAARKLHWLRFRQTVENKRAKILEQKEESRDWSAIPELYRRVEMPVPSAASYIPPGELEKQVDQEALPVTVSGAEAIPEQVFLASQEEGGTMFVVSVGNLVDKEDGHPLNHLDIALIDDGWAVAGHVADGGAWTTRVTWWQGEEKKTYKVARGNWANVFDGTTERVMLNSREHLAVIYCVHNEDYSVSQVIADLVDTETGRLTQQQVLHSAEGGDFDDYTDSGRLETDGGHEDVSVATWTWVGEKGFVGKMAKWNEGAGKFELVEGTIAPEEFASTQFYDLIDGDPATGKAWLGLTNFPGGGKLEGMVAKKNVITGANGESLRVMEVEGDEVLDETKIEGIGFRVYSVIRFARNPANPHEWAAITQVLKNGKAVLKVEMCDTGVLDNDGQPVRTTFYLPQGSDVHRVMADIQFHQEGHLVITCCEGASDRRMREAVVVIPRHLSTGNQETGGEMTAPGSAEGEASLSTEEWGSPVTAYVSARWVNLHKKYVGDKKEVRRGQGTFSHYNVDYGQPGILGQGGTPVTVKEVDVKSRIFLPLIEKHGFLIGGPELGQHLAQLQEDYPDMRLRMTKGNGQLIVWDASREQELRRDPLLAEMIGQREMAKA